ncbi:molybdopterin molybdotransferase MoeA [Henriciella aquimarina]|uniref:molybdopterin molybdotransferase MoeA n=1 Tax=Henriciella aquimarina TaxID=545261 RepID=UPI000A052F2F|nr:molybdopterin molybdotransferase MoeA [Henriciella aquimarina]
MPEPVSVSDALEQLARSHSSPDGERLPLAACLGRILREPITARATLPPADVSAMDGYAVRLEDVRHAGADLIVLGEAPAGRSFDQALGKMQAVRIFTGGALPPGADHILVQEDAERDGDMVRVMTAQQGARHVRRKGLDFSLGDPLLPSGTSLGPAELALAAAANHAELVVVRRPKIGLLASGNELKVPGSALRPGEIANSNTTAISSLVSLWGGEPVDLGLAPDSLEGIAARIDHGRGCDMIIAIGGASVGDHDLMRTAFNRAGARMVFEKVDVKPGKPTWHAMLNDIPVLGLPGNPATAYVCAHLFLAPHLPAYAGESLRLKAKLEHDLPPNGGRETYIRARLTQHLNGRSVRALTQQDTALLHPFLEANCLIRREPHATSRADGDAVECALLAASPRSDR